MDEIRNQLISFLTTSQAHMTFMDAVKDFPMERMNELPPHVDYTPWMLLEHIRRTQKDLLDFMVSGSYNEPEWPRDYWPEKGEKANEEKWQKTVDDYQHDLAALVSYVQNTETDLSGKVANGNGQTIVREILLAIDHTAYHIGEFAILRQVMGTWPKKREE